MKIETRWEDENTLVLDLIEGDEQFGVSCHIAVPEDVTNVLPHAIAALIDTTLKKRAGITSHELTMAAVQAVKEKFEE